MKSNKLLIKMLIVFASFFVLFLLNSTKVSASSKTFTLGTGQKVVFDDFPSEFIYSNFYVFEDKYNYYVFNCDPAQSFLTYKNTDSFYAVWADGTKKMKDGRAAPFLSAFYSKNGKRWTEVVKGSNSSGVELVSDKSYYCSTPVYDYDDLSTVVFRKAPQTVEQVKIPAIQQAEEIPQAMAEVLKILIPVGLVIFGIGLVIYLIRYCRSRLM